MTPRYRTPSAPLLVLLLASNGCDEQTPPEPVSRTAVSVAPRLCTLLACGTELDFQFTEPIARAAEYELDIESPLEDWGCSFRIGARVGDFEWACDPGLSLDLCEQGVCGFSVRSAPDDLRLLLRGDDTHLVDAEISPTYLTEMPNGPGCLPHCKSASVNVTWNDVGGRVWQVWP